MAKFVEVRKRPEKKASPRWQILAIVVGAIVVVAAGVAATFLFGGGHFFS